MYAFVTVILKDVEKHQKGKSVVTMTQITENVLHIKGLMEGHGKGKGNGNGHSWHCDFISGNLQGQTKSVNSFRSSSLLPPFQHQDAQRL